MKVKKLFLLGVALILLFSLFSFAGCYGDYGMSTGGVSSYKTAEFFLKTGDTVKLDFKEQFKNSGLNVAKYEAESSNEQVITVKNDGTITAVDSGTARVTAILYDRDAKTRRPAAAAIVYVTNRATMTEVKTAQDLSDIRNDLSGAYILKNDIDLKDFGNWNSIGNWEGIGNYKPEVTRFTGVFVNPDGYKIKNLTTEDNSFGFYGGLFTELSYAYIDGLILENVSIDKSSAGGICDSAAVSMIRNCSVDGSIAAWSTAGGIAGAIVSSTKIVNCRFKGEVQVQQDPGNGSEAGGIAGISYACHIVNCTVEATITGGRYVGGIAGSLDPNISTDTIYEMDIVRCTFSGELKNGRYMGEMYGCLKHGQDL